MRISEDKKTKLYNAIHEPIMKKRIAIENSRSVQGNKNRDYIDTLLFRANIEIWQEIKKVLNIK